MGQFEARGQMQRRGGGIGGPTYTSVYRGYAYPLGPSQLERPYYTNIFKLPAALLYTYTQTKTHN